jgi:VanZ family protein
MKRKMLLFTLIIFAVAWLGVIFFMSSQTATESDQISKKVTKAAVILGEKVGTIEYGTSNSEQMLKEYNISVRKFAHVAMYFLLASLIFVVLWQLRVKKLLSVIINFLICIFIAFMDEINQMKFSGRNSGVISEGINDIYKDFFGITTAILILLIIRIINENRSKKVQ